MAELEDTTANVAVSATAKQFGFLHLRHGKATFAGMTNLSNDRGLMSCGSVILAIPPAASGRAKRKENPLPKWHKAEKLVEL